MTNPTTADAYRARKAAHHAKLTQHFIEVTFADGSSARWAVADDATADRAVEALTTAIGGPDTVGP